MIEKKIEKENTEKKQQFTWIYKKKRAKKKLEQSNKEERKKIKR